ncbi:B- and T-lymphocyte attenuator isoform X2 [Callospermophilus lateralis]|uniref:B- and T-lymphocyte attenuator isoform X2 n=1 Tax=Callospermophilus lateralis TaxID=76772 RepID=UPI0040542500
MKTSPAMCRIGKLFGVLFLIPHLGFWSIHGEESCIEQLSVKRHSAYHAPAGSSFKMECPVKYCAKRPNMTWCKFNGTQCFQLGDRLQPHTSWEERQNISVFFLHFEPVLPSDNGSYSCQAHFRSFVSPSHSIILYVTGKQKKPSDIEGREINLVDVSQPLRSEQAEVSIRENSQTLPSQTEIYDNDSLFRIREGSEVYSNPSLDENKQGIVYASLNHSIIGVNLRQARPVQEAPTEYASVCVRSQSRS